MANDLKPIGRQFSEQNIDLGQSTAFSRMQQSLTQLSEFASGKASELFEQDAIAKGKQLALSKQGIPQDLAPSANRTTSAFNNAYNEMTAGILSTKLEGLLSNNLALKSNPATLGPGSVAELNALNNSTWLGFESEIPKNMRADMEYAFTSANAKSLSIMSSTLSSFNKANIEADMKIVGDRAKENYAATILTGNKQQEQEALAEVVNWAENAATLNGMTDIQKQDQIRQIQDIAIDSHVHRDMMESLIQGGESGLTSYIVKTLNSTPEQLGVSPAQKQIMVESALKYNTKLTNEMNIASSQGYNNIVLESIQNPGSISSIQQLNGKISEQQQKGFPLSEAQQIQLAAKVLGKNKKEAARAATNSEINESVSSGDINIVNYSPSDINNYWEDLLKSATEKTKQLEADGAIKPGQMPGWQLEAQAAVNIQRDVPALTQRIEARLTGPNSDNVQNGIRQYSFLKTNNPLALKGLSPKIDAFARTVLDKAVNVTDPVTISTIIAEAREGVLNADQDVVQARINAYKDWVRKNPNAVDTQIRGAIGLSRGLFTDFAFAGNIPDVQRARYNRILETNIPLFEEKDQQLAFKKTNEEFKNIYKLDPGFAPPGMTVSNAVTNLPWSNTTGPMNSNQVVQAISGLVEINNKYPGKNGFTFEHSSKMTKFPSKISDNDKLNKQYAPNGHWMKINGIDRRIYLTSPNYSSTNPFSPNAYQIYWGDTGKDGKSPEAVRPLTTMISTKLRNGKEQVSMGAALMTVAPPNDYIPDLYKKQQNTMAQTGFNQSAMKSLNAEDPIKITDFYRPPGLDNPVTRRIKAKKEGTAPGTKAAKKASDIQAQFETEKRVRDELKRIQQENEGNE